MESSLTKRNAVRKKRVMRVRRKIFGTAQKPRLCVVKSNQHLYVQLIDDENSVTLASVSTLTQEFKNLETGRKTVASGKQLGVAIATRALAKEIEGVVFDRGRSKYHGVVAAVAEGAREKGLRL